VRSSGYYMCSSMFFAKGEGILLPDASPSPTPSNFIPLCSRFLSFLMRKIYIEAMPNEWEQFSPWAREPFVREFIPAWRTDTQAVPSLTKGSYVSKFHPRSQFSWLPESSPEDLQSCEVARVPVEGRLSHGNFTVPLRCHHPLCVISMGGHEGIYHVKCTI